MLAKYFLYIAVFLFFSAGICLADATSATQPTVNTDALQVVPADARFCFVARNMQSVVTKFMAIESRINGQSQSFDPTAMLTQMLGPSFDPNGSVAAVMTGQGLLSDDATDTDMAIFLPAKDSAKLTAIFNPKAGPDGILQGTFPVGMGGASQPMFLATYPGYVAIAPTEKAIKALQSAGRTLGAALTPQVQDKINNSDIYLYFNTAAITKNADQQLNQSLDSAEQSIDSQVLAGSGELKAVLDILRLAVLQSIKDNQYGLVTIRMDNQGVTIDTIAEFQSGSSTAKLLEAQPALPANALAGLPNKDYVGVWTDSINGRAVYEWLNSLNSSSGPAMDAQKQQIQAAITKLLDDDVQPMTDHVSDTAMVLLPTVTQQTAAPAGAASGTGAQVQLKSMAISVPGVIFLCSSTDPAKDAGLIPSWVNSTIQSITSENQGLKIDAQTAPVPLNINGTLLTRVDLSISDAKLTSTQTSSRNTPALTTQIYYGAVQPSTVMIACNVDQDTLQETVANINSGTAGVEQRPDLAQVRKEILPGAFFAAYVPIARLELLMNGQTSGNQQAAAMPSDALALGVPPPPVAISVADIGTAIDV